MQLIVTGPRVPARLTVDEILVKIDLHPSFTELGGAGAPASIDGWSLVPLLHGQKVAEWRTVALVEHRRPHKDPTDPDAPALRSGNPMSCEAIRGLTSLYVENADGEKECHGLVTDLHEMHNSFSSLSGEEKAPLHAMLGAVEISHAANGCRAADRPGHSPMRR